MSANLQLEPIMIASLKAITMWLQLSLPMDSTLIMEINNYWENTYGGAISQAMGWKLAHLRQDRGRG